MAWFADLACKAENLLNNLDEQTGVALRTNQPQPRPIKRIECGPSPNTSRNRNPISRRTPNKKEAPYLQNSNSRTVSPNAKQCTKDFKVENKLRTTKFTPPKLSKTDDNSSETFVGGVINYNNFSGVRYRRLSLPTDNELKQPNFGRGKPNLEVENTVLKNELSVLHEEVSQLLERLNKAEDGNDVVRDQELEKQTMKLESAGQEEQCHKLCISEQFQELKLRIHDLTVTEMDKQRQHCKNMELDIEQLKRTNKELEDAIRELKEDAQEKKVQKIKTEKDLKHAQATISELQENLERTTSECVRLESEWDAYKLRVKSMLSAKDAQIKQLQEGLNLTEDTKILIEHLDLLKEERDELSVIVMNVRKESNDIKQRLKELEAQSVAADCMVSALRDALREERAGKTSAEAQAATLNKELKALQLGTNKTIAALHAAVREKDNELIRLKEASISNVDTCALNVADYSTTQATIDNEKIQYLTQALVQRQGKVDSLLAEKHMLRIQLEKLESKFKMELSSRREQEKHSVVHVQEETRSRRTRHTGSLIQNLSFRLGHMYRYPLFRLFLLFYMVCLHFWVITVLLTSSTKDLTSSLYKESLDKSQPFQT